VQLAKPLLQSIFGFDEKAYRNFLKERKAVIYKILFNEEPEDELVWILTIYNENRLYKKAPASV